LRKWPRVNAVADGVIEFLHSDAAHAQPFLLSVGCYEVHRRFELPEYTRGDPASVTVHPFLRDTPEVREDLAWFHGSIEFMDQHVGRILDALRASGLEQNTIVVFTTDHGAALLRAKGTLYDPGIGTALIVRWPGHVAENQTCNELLSNVDLLPTLIELAGGTPGPMIQGRSFASLLTGGSWTPRPAVFSENNYRDEYDPMRAIRTGRYKYIRSFEPQFGHPISKDIRRSHSILSLRVEDCAARPAVELYDLETDPHEVRNLADDPACLEVRNDLAGQLHQWMVDTSDPLLAGPIAAPPGATVEPPFASAAERFAAIMQEYRQHGGT
jgi:arylsulfatase A-like enzyme